MPRIRHERGERIRWERKEGAEREGERGEEELKQNNVLVVVVVVVLVGDVEIQNCYFIKVAISYAA
jgi:hypothetical protein